MRIRFRATFPKDMSAPELNEDAFAPKKEVEVDRIAISDGASESYNSQLWAKLLVNQYVSNLTINSETIDTLIHRYGSEHNYASMSWSQQAAYERGSFASLLGVEYNASHNELDIIAVGDSIAVLIDNDGGTLLTTYPYHESSQFDQRPTLISTIKRHNEFISDSQFHTTHSKSIPLSESDKPILLLMTDALGQWALKNQERGTPVWKLLSSMTKSKLKKLIKEEREHRRMRTDDVTLLVIDL